MRASTGGAVEESARGVEGDGGLGSGFEDGGTPAVGVADGVGGVQGFVVPLVLDPGRLAGLDEAAGDGDEATGEEALIELVVGTVEREGGVATHATAHPHGEGGTELLLVEVIEAP